LKNKMAVLINSLILSLINIISIFIGSIIYYISKSQTQVAIQIISACFFSIIFFLIWQFVSQKFFPKTTLRKKPDYWKTYFGSLIFSTIIFTLLHYLTEGYLTPWKNISGITMFQIPTNILILKIYQNFSSILEIRYKKNFNEPKN